MSKVLLLLGAGANIGLSTIRSFSSTGWKIAAVSRTTKPTIAELAHLTLIADLADPSSIADIFAKVTSELGPPSAVVYNAAGSTRAPEENPLALSPADFDKDTSINVNSLYAAAHEAVKVFAHPDAPKGPKTFVYTGNVLNHMFMTHRVSLGAGKSAGAHVIQVASAAYKDSGWRFYYVDERKSDGSPVVMDIGGDAKGQVFR